MLKSQNHLGYIKEPTFIVSGNNGATIVEEYLTEMGWQKSDDPRSENYKLKWVECKSRVDYNKFKSGEQLVNRIPNNSVLTNKLGLLSSLQAYERICWGMINGPKMRMEEFLPETYKLDDLKERQEFYEAYKPGEMWICKPSCLNQGKGIFLVRDLKELNKYLIEREEKQKAHKRTIGRIVQRYIHNPLLLEGRKFDIRVFMLIASTTPFIVLYHRGYVRLSLLKYDKDSTNLVAHLTNQYVQKKDPGYQELGQGSTWTMDQFNEYINEHVATQKGIEKDWVFRTLPFRIKQIIKHCFNAVKHKLQTNAGFFDLYGLDFMVDENMKVWLIEVNSNPSLSTNCDTLKKVIPDVVKETISLALECFEKGKRHLSLKPLESMKNFQTVYHGGTGFACLYPSTKPMKLAPYVTEYKKTVSLKSGIRRARSLPPAKETEINDQPVECERLTEQNKKSKLASFGIGHKTKTCPESTKPVILKLTHGNNPSG